MDSAICTLFEGHYHYGVAALVNSLYAQGYRGNIYVGYRGDLPVWAEAAKQQEVLNWPGCQTMYVADGLHLYLLPLDTSYHLTNYKPDFMIRLWNSLASETESMFYFDPDIVVNAPWSVFKEWTTYGVALCEDIMSPKPMNHPTRQAWRQYFDNEGFALNFKEAFYANGGFVGVSKRQISFLLTWQSIQESMAIAIGGLDNAFLIAQPSISPFAPFSLTDQDALNATVEAWEGPVSFVDKNGMGFGPNASLMSHAIGSGKPWVRKTLIEAINGFPPRRADREYWAAANGVIKSQSVGLIRMRQLAIKIAVVIGRFYSRK
jgi:hypothetical protein